MKLKPSSKFHNDPFKVRTSGQPELPVNTVVQILTGLSGPLLQMMTRMTPQGMRAEEIGYIYVNTLGSEYVKGKLELIERCQVSIDGGGRQDMIESLRAGGTVPDAYYYGTEQKPTEYAYIREEGEERPSSRHGNTGSY